MSKYYLLFDLDGTLVNTDSIYVEIWSELLKVYKIVCDKSFFNYFIKGNSDTNFLKYIISDINDEEIKNISNKKDELFLKKIENTGILIDGVMDFFETIKNEKIAIVTNSNKAAAKRVLEITGLEKYINILIAAEDCKRHKPDAEPYLKAIKLLDAKKDKTIIFEDSYPGYLSAKNTGLNSICLVENEETCIEVKNLKEYKINNYINFKLENIINFIHEDSIDYSYLSEIMENIITKPIKNISKCNDNLKTGYICNINNYDIEYTCGNKENIVLKISNLENELSKTALKLNMYENETYFYKHISYLLNNVPKYMGSFKDKGKDAIILENLNKYNGKFDSNLNNNIKLLVTVVDTISDIHSSFYFKNEESVIPVMKNVKKVKDILYYRELIDLRFEKFINKVSTLLDKKELNILKNIYDNLDKIYEESSCFPLSFCHGDLKSPNIFYKNNREPILLDWQYIQLNKGISDIIFLLIESIEFDEITVNIVVNYYYKLQKERSNITYDEYMKDLKNALCVFPFFVCVWFNSEDSDKLLDPVFPIRFLKDLMKYYNYFLG